MSDLVIRLRNAAESGDMPLGKSMSCLYVADEIERLQEEVIRLMELIIDWCDACDSPGEIAHVGSVQALRKAVGR